MIQNMTCRIDNFTPTYFDKSQELNKVCAISCIVLFFRLTTCVENMFSMSCSSQNISNFHFQIHNQITSNLYNIVTKFSLNMFAKISKQIKFITFLCLK